MENTYKRVPFDIELANKIQSGEIEGRIMYNGKIGGEEIIVLSYDYEKYRRDYPIRFVYVNHDEIDYLNDTSSLFIELPEETDNTTITDDWYKTEDVKGKIELVASKMGLTYEQFIIVMDSLKGIIKINSGMIQLLDDMKEDIERICETPKHKFKPFDKVLARDNNGEKWVPDVFRFYDNSGDYNYPYRCCSCDYKQCIPYEGNEHLVGKTDNLKED